MRIRGHNCRPKLPVLESRDRYEGTIEAMNDMHGGSLELIVRTDVRSNLV